MRNIAIVEDENAAAALLSEYIERFSAQNGQPFNITRYRTADEFLSDYKAIFSVVFMDVQMPGTDGMSASFELRKIDKTVSIVFITNLIQYAQKGYEVDAVAFLVKPVQYFDFALKFRKALDIFAMNEKKDMMLNVAGGVCRISTDKLMYIEVMRHRLYYHTVDSVIEVTGVLNKVEKELSDFGFLRCNQCYLVNPRFIVNVKGMNVQVGNDLLTISRPRRNAFMAELAKWYAGAEGNT